MVQRKKKGDFFETIKNKAKEARDTSSEYGLAAWKKSGEVSKQLADKGKEGLDKGKEFAQTATTSNQDVIDLIEKLGALKKSGLLTDEEFQTKKTELLAKI